MPAIPEAELRAILTDALSGLKGLGKKALESLLNEYAPRFARLAAAADPVAAAAEHADLMVNVKLSGRVAGVVLEATTAKVVNRVFSVAASLMLRYVGLPPVPPQA